jgi:predicted dehydrogenase
LLRDGAIGQLVRLEGTTGNLYDWGTHWFDMLFFYNEETPAEWVIGQIDLRGSEKVFGVPVEGHGLTHFRFQNGVDGVMFTGVGANNTLTNRLIGTDGMIEVGHSDAVPLRYWGKGMTGWQAVEMPEGLHSMEAVQRGVLDLVEALKTGRAPELAGRKALRATEVIFATYESSRRRARIDLPLEIEDSPLIAMLAQQGL